MWAARIWFFQRFCFLHWCPWAVSRTPGLHLCSPSLKPEGNELILQHCKGGREIQICCVLERGTRTPVFPCFCFSFILFLCFNNSMFFLVTRWDFPFSLSPVHTQITLGLNVQPWVLGFGTISSSSSWLCDLWFPYLPLSTTIKWSH